MNKHDRDNLQFIISLNDEQFDDWASEMTDDDIQYAIEILQAARMELVEQEQALMEYDLVDSDLVEARAVLQKFRL